MQPGSFQWCLMTARSSGHKQCETQDVPCEQPETLFHCEGPSTNGRRLPREVVVSLSLEMLGFCLDMWTLSWAIP